MSFVVGWLGALKDFPDLGGQFFHIEGLLYKTIASPVQYFLRTVINTITAREEYFEAGVSGP